MHILMMQARFRAHTQADETDLQVRKIYREAEEVFPSGRIKGRNNILFSHNFRDAFPYNFREFRFKPFRSRAIRVEFKLFRFGSHSCRSVFNSPYDLFAHLFHGRVILCAHIKRYIRELRD